MALKRSYEAMLDLTLEIQIEQTLLRSKGQYYIINIEAVICNALKKCFQMFFFATKGEHGTQYFSTTLVKLYAKNTRCIKFG